MLGTPLIRKHRGAARLTLYVLPILLLAGTLGYIEVAGRLCRAFTWGEADYSRIESVRLLQEYLRFDTSHPDGNEIPAAEFLARQLEAAGIEAHVERLGDRNANMWAIIEGEDPKALVLHNHLDTDPVRDPRLWRHPPFSGTLDPPFIYGRGAFDMKSYAIAQLMATRDAAESLRPRRSLVFLATSDEEIDSRLGTVWVLREYPRLAERFWAVLTEGGAVEAMTADRVKYWGTEIGQKRFVDVWVCGSSRQRLETLRHELNARRLDLNLPAPPVAEFFRLYGPSRERPLIRRVLADPVRLFTEPDLTLFPNHLKALLRNELAAFPVEEDPGGGYRMKVIFHLLPEANFEQAFAELVPGGLPGLALSIDVPHEASAISPTDHEVFRAIHRHMAEIHPDFDHGPLIVPWSATDARFFRAAGIPSYGFAPFLVLSAQATKMKGANERIPAPSFVEGVASYVGLVRRLVGPGDGQGGRGQDGRGQDG